jgi:hypothetical protein
MRRLLAANDNLGPLVIAGPIASYNRSSGALRGTLGAVRTFYFQSVTVVGETFTASTVGDMSWPPFTVSYHLSSQSAIAVATVGAVPQFAS